MGKAKNIRVVLTAGLILSACARSETLKPLVEASITKPPDVMTIKIQKYNAQAGKTFQHLFVSNYSTKLAKGQISRSSSRDGMPDSLKQSLNANYGFNFYGPETVAIGFADLLLFDMGIQSPQQNLLYCSPTQFLSTSNDAIIYNDARLSGSPVTFLGLRDCEKNYMGLNPANFNNAGDGIPDYLKLRCGLNPANKFDAFVSTSGDGVANIDKCKWNLPIDEDSNTDANQLLRYRYDIQVLPDGSTEFTVSNIPIIDGGKDNFLVFYLIESDINNKNLSLYSAFSIIKAGYSGKTLKFDYWVKNSSPMTFFNQEILAP